MENESNIKNPTAPLEFPVATAIFSQINAIENDRKTLVFNRIFQINKEINSLAESFKGSTQCRSFLENLNFKIKNFEKERDLIKRFFKFYYIKYIIK